MTSGHQLQNAEASSDASRHVSAEGLAKRFQNPVEWGSALNLDHVQTILSEELCLESSHFQEGPTEVMWELLTHLESGATPHIMPEA